MLLSPLLQAVAIATAPSLDWIERLVPGVGVALAGWALARSVKHGEQLQQLTTFTGADGRNGMAEQLAGLKRDVADKLDQLEKSIHSLRNIVQTIAVDTAIVKAKVEEHK